MKCGLLGRKLGHSYSPAIHGLLADYSYDRFEKEPEELEDFLLRGDWDGLNVTIPYKKEALRYCGELSPLARELGCVNVLIRRPDGTIFGDNTDAWGFRVMAQSLQVDYGGKKALVLGTGGASAVAQAILKELGCQVVVISRRGEDNYDNLQKHADARVLVNTTPVGMYPGNGESPVNLDAFPHLEAVLDVIYNPARTKLILDAETRNIPCVGGFSMLIAQAVRACELWTGGEIPAETAQRVQKTIGSQMENIVLIGMPGCGKTTVGKKLAKALNRPFADADEELTKKIGDISTFLSSHGEEAFRKAETEVLVQLGNRSGLVIATGGGCVTRRENYDLLHQNGKIFWIRRALDALPTKGRPLSEKAGVSALYEQRKPLYETFADEIVDNDGAPEDAVASIMKE